MTFDEMVIKYNFIKERISFSLQLKEKLRESNLDNNRKDFTYYLDEYIKDDLVRIGNIKLSDYPMS